MEQGVPDIFANYANADMVAHAMTQLDLFDGVVSAILELDTQLGRLVPAALAQGYTVSSRNTTIEGKYRSMG